jgi:sec-independent protein translocase protein TatC
MFALELNIMSGKADKSEMSFLEHLEELRWHLVRSAFVVVIMAGLAFVFKKLVFDIIILGPSMADFPTNRWLCAFGRHSFLHTEVLCINKTPISLQNIQMAGQFMAHIKISLISGLVVAFPYVFYEFWRFVRPALYQNEKNVAQGAVLAITMLFFVGVAFGYFIISPLSINFLFNYQVTELAKNDIQLMSYVSLVAGISLASGVLFELPVIVYFFSKIGLLTPAFLRRYRRHAIIVILLIAAIITPPDVFSQVLVSMPLLLLYEISIGISRRIEKKQLAEFDQT